jgi:hypothetical protein
MAIKDLTTAIRAKPDSAARSAVLEGLENINRTVKAAGYLGQIVQSVPPLNYDRRVIALGVARLLDHELFKSECVPQGKTPLQVIKDTAKCLKWDSNPGRFNTIAIIAEGMEKASDNLNSLVESGVLGRMIPPSSNKFLPPEDVWKFCMDFRRQDSGQYAFESEPGYMAGMYNGLKFMLDSIKQNPPVSVSADWLQSLHDSCVEGVLTDQGVDNFAQLAKGFRENTTNGFTLSPDRNCTDQGVRELQAITAEGGVLHKHSSVLSHGQQGWEIRTVMKSSAECATLANRIFEEYKNEINAAQNPDAKYAAIAKCCRNLEVAHLFRDGNARTIGFLLVNKLLLDNDLQATIMEDPNHFDGHSIAQLVEEITKGQERFANVCRQQTENQQTTESASQLMNQGFIRG